MDCGGSNAALADVVRWASHARGGQAKAVSPLRSATAVHNGDRFVAFVWNGFPFSRE
jgi:hypothetical protein